MPPDEAEGIQGPEKMLGDGYGTNIQT